MPHGSDRNGKAVINITSAIRKATHQRVQGVVALPHYIAWDKEAGSHVNPAGRYDYLELPYFISQDYENAGRKIFPTCKEALDTYVTPLFPEKARLNGLSAPLYYISNNYFEPPVVPDSINPFMIRSRVVLRGGPAGRGAARIAAMHGIRAVDEPRFHLYLLLTGNLFICTTPAWTTMELKVIRPGILKYPRSTSLKCGSMAKINTKAWS